MTGIKDVFIGDCFDMLKNIADDSIDMVFTSPPYAERRKASYSGTPEDK
jgi:site-specific DNA-methyltransferase (cytosine-N4-specific)